MIETIPELVKLFRTEGVTDHVIEKEFGSALGDRYFFKISNGNSVVTGNSFAFFPVVEEKVNGYYTTVICDRSSLISLYTPEEIALIIKRFKNVNQKILQRFHTLKARNNEVGLRDVLILYLETYKDILPMLKLTDKCTFLPDEAEIEEAIKELKNGKSVDTVE